MIDNKRILFVGGNFGDNIRPSGYISQMHTWLEYLGCKIDLFKNGGTFDELAYILSDVVNYDIIMWFVNVPNSFEKLVDNIKALNPHAILVTSKSNTSEKYSYHEIAARMLKVKANLCVVFDRLNDGRFCATIMDPLLNEFTHKETNIEVVADSLFERIVQLSKYTRAASIYGGPAIEVPDEGRFFDIARKCAEKFHELIHAGNADRFLGNLSFRCESGFPSYRNGDTVFVSRRNIDKRLIGKDGFVGVSLTTNNNAVTYFGEHKPSVDTPIQIALYNLNPNVRYMMHSHVYVDGALFTDEKIPCGAMEEVKSIEEKINNIGNASINLRGHGSIVFAKDLDYFNSIIYKARPVLEF